MLLWMMATLAVWRITHLLCAEDGPFDLVVRLRLWVGEGFFGQLMDCFYCLSIWVSLPFAIGLCHDLMEGSLWWFSLSGGAILLERFSLREPSSHYQNQKE